MARALAHELARARIKDAEARVLGDHRHQRAIKVVSECKHNVRKAGQGLQQLASGNVPVLDGRLRLLGRRCHEHVLGKRVKANGVDPLRVRRKLEHRLRHVLGQSALGDAPDPDGAVVTGWWSAF